MKLKKIVGYLVIVLVFSFFLTLVFKGYQFYHHKRIVEYKEVVYKKIIDYKISCQDKCKITYDYSTGGCGEGKRCIRIIEDDKYYDMLWENDIWSINIDDQGVAFIIPYDAIDDKVSIFGSVANYNPTYEYVYVSDQIAGELFVSRYDKKRNVTGIKQLNNNWYYIKYNRK